MATVEENKRSQIEQYKREIESLINKIEFFKEEILKLQGKTIECPNCNGEGRIMTVHRVMSPHKYMTCRICKGVGKITEGEFKQYESNEYHKDN